MPSLLTDAQKTAIANVFDDMHDTFARDITVYQKKNKIFVATNDTYNALYKRIKDAKTTRTEVTSTTVKARILYVDKQIERDMGGLKAQINVPLSEGIVRIKIEKSGYDLFKKAQEVEIDGARYNIISDDSAIGPFVVKFYTLYLQRSN
tara:strand:+ start:19314 stop:19760 length:447 start_codon:yes stop_codon:yes gene_type:complete